MSINIWFMSDSHYKHKNIVRGVSNWPNKDQCRDFDTLEDHDTTLVDNINEVVKKEDILYHLGDWSFGGASSPLEFRRRINCENIHLIYGNHDVHIRKDIVYMGEKRTYRPEQLFLSRQDYLEKKIANIPMILMHYSMRTWHKAHHGSWMLYGHSHGTLPEYEQIRAGTIHMIRTPYKTMDIGVDTHPEFRPYNIDELRVIMDKRVPLTVDHHNENTTE